VWGLRSMERLNRSRRRTSIQTMKFRTYSLSTDTRGLMYTTPENWFERLKKAGGSARVELGNLAPSPDVPMTPELEQIWSEIQGRSFTKVSASPCVFPPGCFATYRMDRSMNARDARGVVTKQSRTPIATIQIDGTGNISTAACCAMIWKP
jgi:hypothetical protein